jgi:hypothetical protein
VCESVHVGELSPKGSCNGGRNEMTIMRFVGSYADVFI